MSGLIDEIITAHGGIDSWQNIRSLTVYFSAQGLAFRSRFQPHALLRAEATVYREGQSVTVRGVNPHPWTFCAHSAEVLRDAAENLRTGRQRWLWSPEDAGAFAALAMWTYVQVPFRLGAPDIVARELTASREGHRRLEVRFPETVATHSPIQILHVDRSGVLVRHDYIALVFGRWAKAAQILGQYRSFDGLRVPTIRRVTPRVRDGRRLRAPTLVSIDVHNVTVERTAPENLSPDS